MNEVLSIVHEEHTGWHTFTSLQLPGLFLTGSEEQLGQLREDLPAAITALVKADTGRRVWLEPVPSFSIGPGRAGKPEVLHFAATELVSDAEA